MVKNPFRYFKTSPEIIQLAVLLYARFPLSLRNIEDLLHERGIDVCHESVRLWVDRFGSYFAHKIRHLNNRAENSHLPFRRRERAMSRFRRMRSLQKFVSMHSSVYNHFNFERHINPRIQFKQKRDAALREWRDLLVA